MKRSNDGKYLASLTKRYAKASKKERGQILDEYVQTTGYHRKYAAAVACGRRSQGRSGATTRCANNIQLETGRPQIGDPDGRQRGVFVGRAGAWSGRRFCKARLVGKPSAAFQHGLAVSNSRQFETAIAGLGFSHLPYTS